MKRRTHLQQRSNEPQKLLPATLPNIPKWLSPIRLNRRLSPIPQAMSTISPWHSSRRSGRKFLLQSPWNTTLMHGCGAMLLLQEPRWQGVTIHGPITEVKQPWAWSILGWVTIQDTVLVAKDVIVTCHVPLWLMSYEHTRGSQSAP